MLALASAWIGLVSLLMATSMVLYRPAFSDLGVTLVLYFGTPGAICLGGLVLWAHRRDIAPSSELQAQRLQAWVGITLAVLSAAMVYWLVIGAERIVRSV